MKIYGPAESLLSSKFPANQALFQPQCHLGLSPSIWNSGGGGAGKGASGCWEDSPGSLSLQHMSRAPPSESSAAWFSLSLLQQDEKTGDEAGVKTTLSKDQKPSFLVLCPFE